MGVTNGTVPVIEIPITCRLRSYHPGNTTSRPISAVKQDRALSSTVVGDHTETKGDVTIKMMIWM